jgi:hypothetical protein
MIGVIMLVLALTVFRFGSMDAALVVRDIDAANAFWLAESGLERGESWLRAQENLPEELTYPFGDVPDTLGCGYYDVEITPDMTPARPVYTVNSNGTSGTRSRVLEVDVSQVAFSDYLYYVNRNVGTGPAWFYTGETIDGPIHSNGEIGIAGDPIFTDVIESAASTFLYYNDGTPISLSTDNNAPHDEPVFQEGYVLNGTSMDWIAQADFHVVEDRADLVLTGGHELVFGREVDEGPGPGWVSYSKINKDEWTHVELATLTNGVIYLNGDCEVSGVVDGQVSILSNGQIDIVDDLVVFDAGENGPNEGCDDIIGLMAGTKVMVKETEPNSNDCEIHAYLIAVNNQASLVDRYSHGSPRGTLTLYGGIASDKWGPVGTGYFDGDQLVVLTGYQRDFHYDWRLREFLPPGFDDVVFESSAVLRLAWRDVTPR